MPKRQKIKTNEFIRGREKGNVGWEKTTFIFDGYFFNHFIFRGKRFAPNE